MARISFNCFSVCSKKSYTFFCTSSSVFLAFARSACQKAKSFLSNSSSFWCFITKQFWYSSSAWVSRPRGLSLVFLFAAIFFYTASSFSCMCAISESISIFSCWNYSTLLFAMSWLSRDAALLLLLTDSSNSVNEFLIASSNLSVSFSPSGVNSCGSTLGYLLSSIKSTVFVSDVWILNV